MTTIMQARAEGGIDPAESGSGRERAASYQRRAGSHAEMGDGAHQEEYDAGPIGDPRSNAEP